jgi:hypothetical protein
MAHLAWLICLQLVAAVRHASCCTTCTAYDGLQAWQRVLLDGGPCRWFIPADVVALRDDLEALRDLFEARGEGLPR